VINEYQISRFIARLALSLTAKNFFARLSRNKKLTDLPSTLRWVKLFLYKTVLKKPFDENIKRLLLFK
jgi:hypothetical protein